MLEEACGKSYLFNYFGDYSSDAEFFVAAGVLAMLYSLASAAFYCFFDSLYQTNKSFPLVVITEIFRTQSNSSVKPVEFVSQDFLVTLIMGVFWLSGSAAWASGVSSVKYVANPDNFANTLDICRENKGCVTEFAGNFAGLNISIVSHLL